MITKCLQALKPGIFYIVPRFIAQTRSPLLNCNHSGSILRMAKVLKSKIPYKGPSSENLIEFIKNGLNKHPDDTIIVDSKTEVTWTGKELESAITKIASYLVEECGVKKGDVCSIYSEECDQAAILILAVMSTGAVCNYLTTKNSAREVHDTIIILKSKFLFSPSTALKKIKPELAGVEDKIQVVSYDEPCEEFENCRSLRGLFSRDISQNASLTFDKLIEVTKIIPDEDYAVIQFSSGTTGKPKPIPRTHKNLCHLVASVDHEELMDLQPGAVMTGSQPLTHRPGIWALLACVNGGSTMVIWDKLSDVEDALATIAKYKVTIFASSLPFLSMMGNFGVKLKNKFDTSALKHIITAGAKIVNPDLPKLLIKEFNLTSLRQCFGMTESGWIFLIEQSLAKDNYLSVGHVVPGLEAIILNRDTNKPLEAYERGEIALRGAQIFPGYLTDKQGILNRSDFTDDGWFRIGDQGYYDKNEMVFIEGRYKEMMLFENDCKFFPSEIEALISEYPAIEGVCVVKVAEVREDYPFDVARAFVTLKHGYDLTEKELLDYVKEKSPQIILRGGVRILEKFPRLQNNKVDKQALMRL